MSPRPVQQTKAADVKTGHGQTEGMIRQSAIVGMSDHICGTLMRAHPHSGSAVHHHGPQDTIVYAVAGHGTIVSDGGKNRKEMAPGDWAIIPGYAEHQEVNDGEEEVIWVIVRSPGGTPEVYNLTGWGGDEVKG